jgi:tetratricopeptide (TPR) repeat protein
MVCVLFAFVVIVSGELDHRAQIEIGNGQPAVALETLALAQKINPWNSALFQRSGDILLESYVKTKDRKQIESAEASFRRAIDLSPQKFDAHLGLALCLSASDRVDAALDEIALSSQLYPDNEYVRSIARLMKNRVR